MSIMKAIKLEGKALEGIMQRAERFRTLRKTVKEAHKDLWRKIAEHHPETEKGCWQLNTKYAEQGVIIVESDDDCENCNEGKPKSLREVLDSLASVSLS